MTRLQRGSLLLNLARSYVNKQHGCLLSSVERSSSSWAAEAAAGVPACRSNLLLSRGVHTDKTVYTPESLPLDTGRQRLVVLGTGWAAARLLRDIDPRLYDITVRSSSSCMQQFVIVDLYEFDSWCSLMCLVKAAGCCVCSET
jgi:NADH:ubiquinone reductase (non-electrogenic)